VIRQHRPAWREGIATGRAPPTAAAGVRCTGTRREVVRYRAASPYSQAASPLRSVGPLVVVPRRAGRQALVNWRPAEGEPLPAGSSKRQRARTTRTTIEAVAVSPNLEDPEILVPVSLAQAAAVVSQVAVSNAPGTSLIRVLLALGGLDRLGMRDLKSDERFSDPKLAQSVVIALMVLSRFQDCEGHRVKDLALSLELAEATLVRYLRTLLVVGILEQLQDRKYILARTWRNLLTSVE
jgi:hypothetical protein